jgi:hypothetical protein
MPTVKRLITKVTLTDNPISVSISNIPSIYTDLLLVASMRSTRTGTSWVSPFITFNGVDNSTDYSGIVLRGDGASASSYAANLTGYYGAYIGATPTDGHTANTFDSTSVYIPNYAGSTSKSFMATSAGETNGTTGFNQTVAGLWSSTAAINRLTVWANGGAGGHAFAAGCRFYLYGITQVPVIVGGVETISGGYKVHTFTSTSSLRVVEGGVVEYLVVAGGGGGGRQYGGGGGAGGLLTGRAGVSVGNQTVTVGGGGNPATLGQGSDGTSSSVFSLAPSGGGGGGYYAAGADRAGRNGGSGGGGGSLQGSSGAASGGSGTSGQGNAGGSGYHTFGSGASGGGGGGAAAAGASMSGSGGGPSAPGGAGRQVFGSFYAGGGGGGADSNTTGVPDGGQGGGGRGGYLISGVRQSAVGGTANTGGGGGGSSADQGAAAGGSGIVIIRYPYIGN